MSDFRKLQKISGSLYLSLPKSWLDNLNLKKNSKLNISVLSDGALRISPTLKLDELKSEVVLNADRYVARNLVKNCLTGTSKIIINSDKKITPVVLKDIKWFVERLPNTEIISESSNEVIIQNFCYENVPTKKVINRLLFLLSEMFVDVKNNDHKELASNFNDLRRFYFIIVTHIRTYLKTGLYASIDNSFSPLEAMDYRMFSERIDEIGLILKDYKLTSELNDYFTKVQTLFNDVKNAFLKKDSNKACEVWFTRNKLIEEIDKSIKLMSYDNKLSALALKQVIDYCKDMADLI